MILSTFRGFERSYPLIITFSLLMIFFITHDLKYLLFLIAIELSALINQLLKDYVFKNIMGSDEYPIIGRGLRPDHARDCGEFIDIDNREATSYGMPSGHSNFAAFFGLVMILTILNDKYSTNLKIIKITIVIVLSSLILFSRVNLGCHTYQQVIAGTIFGLLFGYIYFINLGKIKSLLKIK